jgi:SAM-dependent methyltransferase
MAEYDFYAEKKVTPLGAFINRRIAARLAAACAGNLPETPGSKPRVLEIGPGQGAFAQNLTAAGTVEYKAYEPEKKLCDRLAARGFAAVNAAVPPLPEADGSFHAVVLNNVLEHMPDITAAQKLLQEIWRVLREKGFVFIIVPSYLDWGKDFYNLDYTHRLVMTESRLSQMLADARFSVRRMSHHYGNFFSGVGRVPNAFAHACRALLTLVLPRSISRRNVIQKAGVLFAENIICIAEKSE